MSQTHNQLVASHEQMDLDEAQERVQRILHGQAGPTLTPTPQTQPASPTGRKKRSDAGVPKKQPADPDEIVLRLTLAEARELAIAVADCNYALVCEVQDQIIAQLQKRLDALQRAK